MSNSHLPIPPIATEAAKLPKSPQPSKTHAEAKAARLQAALRENLRRRKVANASSPEANAPLDATNTPDHEKASPNRS